MKKRILGLAGILLISKLIFGGCSTGKTSIIKQNDSPIRDFLNSMYSNYVNLKQGTTYANLKQETKKEEDVHYPVEGGKIMFKIAGGEGWKNFKNGIDLCAASKKKGSLTPDKFYQFVKRFDENNDDFFNLEECVNLRNAAREIYDDSKLKRIGSRAKAKQLYEVAPGLPSSEDSAKASNLKDAIYKK